MYISTFIAGAHRVSHKLCLNTLDAYLYCWRVHRVSQCPSVESVPCSHKPPHCGRTGGPLATPPDHILMTTTNMMIGWWWNSGEGCQTKIQDFNSSESFLSAFLLKRRNDDERLSIWVDCKAVSRASRKQRNPSAFTTSFFTVWQLTTVYYCASVLFTASFFQFPWQHYIPTLGQPVSCSLLRRVCNLPWDDPKRSLCSF